MSRIRGALADLVVAIIVILAALWLFRGVFRAITWGVSLVLVVILVVVGLRIAGKIRG